MTRKIISAIAAAAALACIPCAAQAASAASPVRVAVVDSGVARTGDIADAVEAEFDMAEGREPFSTRDDHGTAVASVIVRNARRPVRIVSLRVDKDGRCGRDRCDFDIGAVRAAVRKAVEMRVDVINMSLETPFDLQLFVMLQNASNAGIQVVMAAGNGGHAPQGLRYAQTIRKGFWLVGAKDLQGRPAEFSAHPAADCGCAFVWRQGVDVATRKRNGQPTTMSGTSFAAPLMAAEIASAIPATPSPVVVASR